MRDLTTFESPEEGKVTLCEKDGRLRYGTTEDLNITILTNTLEKYPDVHIDHEVFPPKRSDEEARELFVPVETSVLKHIVETYHEHGLKQALAVISYQNKPVISSVSRYILYVLNSLNEVRFRWNPCLRDSNEVMIERSSLTRNWSKSYVRCIEWHKDLPKVAIALNDDSVRIYSKEFQTAPVFRCREQNNISCMAWRPGSSSDLAIGCENWIVIWNVESSSVVIRTSSINPIKLRRINHKPVLSLTWSPSGDVLASVAGRDSEILVWNVEMDLTEALKRGGISGYSLLKWSGNGKKLFSASTSCVFRIWDCLSWEAERWVTVSGYVQAACWSPCSNYLLFASSEEAIIYLLKFGATDRIYAIKGDDSVNSAVPIYDVSKIVIGGRVVGGLVQSMEWDPKGHHLAVLFKETNCIAIFRVVSDFGVILTPGFFIAGQQDEVPYTMTFHPNYSAGACLTIGWSSGRIQYFPIEYSGYTNEIHSRSINNTLNSTNHFNKSYF